MNLKIGNIIKKTLTDDSYIIGRIIHISPGNHFCDIKVIYNHGYIPIGLESNEYNGLNYNTEKTGYKVNILTEDEAMVELL